MFDCIRPNFYVNIQRIFQLQKFPPSGTFQNKKTKNHVVTSLLLKQAWCFKTKYRCYNTKQSILFMSVVPQLTGWQRIVTQSPIDSKRTHSKPFSHFNMRTPRTRYWRSKAWRSGLSSFRKGGLVMFFSNMVCNLLGYTPYWTGINLLIRHCMCLNYYRL